jgi:hypothetical protein
MFPDIHQYVNETVTNLARGGQRSSVIPIPPHGPPAPERSIHDPRDADGETAEAAGECRGIIRLDDQMQVVGPDGELQHAEFGARRGGERAPERGKDARAAKTADALDRPQGRVHGMHRVMLRAGAVQDTGAGAGGTLAAGSGS